MWNIKHKKKFFKKESKNRLIDMDNRLVVTRGEGGRGRAKWIKGVKCMVMDGN